MNPDMERQARDGSDPKAFLNDLLAVVTLPAIWRGGDPSHVGRALADAILRILQPDFVYVRLEAVAGGTPAEIMRAGRTGPAERPVEGLGLLLAECLGPAPAAWPAQARMHFAGDEVTVVTFRLGWQGDGVLVAASQRAGFPTPGERLLLSVTANQAAMGLQEARTLSMQKGVAEELDRRVAQRTRELQRSKELLAETQRLSATGSFSWLPDKDEIAWSDETYRIFRIPQGTLVTMALVEQHVHPEDRASFRQHLQYVRSSSRDVEFDCRLQLPDASVRYLHVIARSRLGEDGEPDYTGAIQDITGRRLAEDALAKASSELAHVARITTLGVLAASIAHEVNQPLSGILTNASTCLRKLTCDPPDVRIATRAAERLLRDGTRAAEVIRRLRALFGKRETATELVDLNDAAREVLALSGAELQRHRVEVRTEFAELLPPVRGDRVQLQQVMLNLVRNACDAMKRVDDRPRRLLVKTQVPGDGNVHLSVCDAGEGFGTQAPERLFESFYTTKEDGMGIGLSVSRSIIEHHRGRMWAAANEGPGATFRFAVPVGMAAGQSARAETSLV
ncbi:sensor histidine kinase [Ramlibacter montanisoli]|uniref:histidine kinase n=1 Tax=Ramlibacter montanisoli TaxID=2732512 RepID=A0A849K2R5_9BURK|nr:ATP-binding protein [Ramlibacter montanisoli]NNU42000.1 PAS domain-containing protein [Ramlibacter montanisoli]